MSMQEMINNALSQHQSFQGLESHIIEEPLNESI